MTRSTNQDRDPDPLYAGLAKQALYKGIPLTLWLVGFVLVVEIFLFTTNFFLTAAVGGILWMVGVAIGKKDPFFLAIIHIKWRKCATVFNSKFWGGNHYRP